MKKTTIDRIHGALDSLFDKMKARFLGVKMVDKTLSISTERPELSLAGLATAAAADDGARISRQSLTGILHVASSYLDSAREKAKAEVVNTALAAKAQGEDAPPLSEQLAGV